MDDVLVSRILVEEPDPSPEPAVQYRVSGPRELRVIRGSEFGEKVPFLDDLVVLSMEGDVLEVQFADEPGHQEYRDYLGLVDVPGEDEQLPCG